MIRENFSHQLTMKAAKEAMGAGKAIWKAVLCCSQHEWERCLLQLGFSSGDIQVVVSNLYNMRWLVKNEKHLKK